MSKKTRILFIGPKHNGIGQYTNILLNGVKKVFPNIEWVGTNNLNFNLEQVNKNAKEIAEYIKNNRFDIIHFQIGMYDQEQIILKFLPPDKNTIPIVTLHGCKLRLSEKVGNQDQNSKLNEILAEYFSHYIFFNSKASDSITTSSNNKHVLFFPSTLEFVRLSKERQFYLRKFLHIPNKFLVLPGYPSPWKDFETIKNAIFQAKLPVPFYFAGPNWEEKLKIRENDQIKYINKELNPSEFLFLVRNSFFGIFPYKDHVTQSGNGVISNYIWEGKAIIATDCLCFKEYLNGKGAIVNQGNSEELSYQMRNYFYNESVRSSNEKEIFRLSREYFSWKNHINKHIELYKNAQ